MITDPPGEGAWNMALDEALLHSAQTEGIATVRFYRWQEPTLSLGYFQSHSDRQLHPASATCPLVRRASGGGAILHDQELTYSIALPAGHPLATRAHKLYQAVHQSLIEALAEVGLAATLYAPPDSDLEKSRDSSAARRSKSDPSFLCFQRRESGDVILGEHKIAGSAQRRQQGAVLQHGSVLWARSKFAPELPGIADLVVSKKNAFSDLDCLPARWLAFLASRLGMSPEPTGLPESLTKAAQKIAREKFGDPSWTCRR
jgi:lipoyl(octanoyl) transferase